MRNRNLPSDQQQIHQHLIRSVAGIFACTLLLDAGKEVDMGVKRAGEKYRCNVCGNEVVVIKAGGGELVCCGQPMEKIEG